MEISVSGAAGFIGTYLIEELLKREIKVVAVDFDISKARTRKWFDKVDFISADLNQTISEETFQRIASSDKFIHLAWPGLPNYKELFHYEKNLMPQYFFIKKLVEYGARDITITGTCLEYGMQNGCLSADLQTDPQNPYSLAKDTLRKFLQELQKKETFKLKWLRLFYIYGKGQSESSILSQLERALNNGEEIFNMSGGEQLRDYLPVEEVANLIVNSAMDEEQNGVYNICSGKPITIRQLVEDYLLKKNKKIKLNLGYYPYPDYEPMSFWGKI
jgi:nucleoside-diphosphate-sugar epimerase